MNPPLKHLSKNFLPRKKRYGSFIDRTLAGIVRKTERALFAEELARSRGFLQALDPRVKIIGLLALIIDTTLAKNLYAILCICGRGCVGGFIENSSAGIGSQSLD